MLDASGFPERNIWSIKQFHETYKDNEKLSPLVAENSLEQQSPDYDRYIGLRCHAFAIIKRHISDNRKAVALPGKIVYCWFG